MREHPALEPVRVRHPLGEGGELASGRGGRPHGIIGAEEADGLAHEERDHRLAIGCKWVGMVVGPFGLPAGM